MQVHQAKPTYKQSEYEKKIHIPAKPSNHEPPYQITIKSNAVKPEDHQFISHLSTRPSNDEPPTYYYPVTQGPTAHMFTASTSPCRSPPTHAYNPQIGYFHVTLADVTISTSVNKTSEVVFTVYTESGKYIFILYGYFVEISSRSASCITSTRCCHLFPGNEFRLNPVNYYSLILVATSESDLTVFTNTENTKIK